ncbi:hypothetical protein AJ87_27235 [Rhizobium yanglingense]|nr:hypothetical protein AJ87_27235 [Rhizobium yanglingense]
MHLEGIGMAAIVEALKKRLSELDARIEQLRTELALAEDQRKAVVTVIGLYDPDGAKQVTQAGDRSTPARQATDLLKGRDVRRGILQTLRDAETPIFAARFPSVTFPVKVSKLRRKGSRRGCPAGLPDFSTSSNGTVLSAPRKRLRSAASVGNCQIGDN